MSERQQLWLPELLAKFVWFITIPGALSVAFVKLFGVTSCTISILITLGCVATTYFGCAFLAIYGPDIQELIRTQFDE